MKRLKFVFIPFALLMLYFSSCEKVEKIDKTKPVIDLTIIDAFPLNCDTLYFGEPFELKVLFSDN
ncbi:MAG: DUF4625 domain-containing protein, partial [Bacteroidales bacterium]|nr:DUF4625 domain-containing protein [Bacteroidales bacterium]